MIGPSISSYSYKRSVRFTVDTIGLDIKLENPMFVG